MSTIDPILASVIGSRITAAGERMGRVIERSARSSLLVEGRDFSLGLYDVNGRLVEQTEYIPILGFATAPAMEHIAAKFRGKVSPGDAILHNDTYSGGNQASDWKVAKPVFHDDEHFAWVVVTAHQAEVGGSVPGSYNPHARDLWQEALRITAVKIHEGGERREDVWDLIFGNVRMSVVAEDVTAMIGACTVGERELQAITSKYGLDLYQTVVDNLFETTEKIARDFIRRIPNGVYSAEVVAHSDGVDHDALLPIRVKVTVGDEDLEFDFEGTAPQTPGYVNAPYAVTLSSVMITFFMLADSDIPHNDALMRCISIKVPEGSMLNPRYPAATGFGNHLSDQICTAIMDALADALPERVTAGWNPLYQSIVSGVDPRTNEEFVDIFINALKGGGGATHGADGFSHIGLIASGGAIGAQDPEMFEQTNPVLITKFEYTTDSGGAGEWRGGLGVETVMEFLADGTQASVNGDGDTEETSARGLRGGLPGTRNAIEFHYPDGRVVVPKLKDLITDIPRGTIYRQLAGGGGGLGDPCNRPAELVRDEVRGGYISIEAAREVYNVVIDEQTGAINEEGTANLRAKVS